MVRLDELAVYKVAMERGGDGMGDCSEMGLLSYGHAGKTACQIC